MSKLLIAKKIGVYNVFGDEQTDIDIKAHDIIVKHLSETEVVRGYLSYESPKVR